jgi:hypothetical protein
MGLFGGFGRSLGKAFSNPDAARRLGAAHAFLEGDFERGGRLSMEVADARRERTRRRAQWQEPEIDTGYVPSILSGTDLSANLRPGPSATGPDPYGAGPGSKRPGGFEAGSPAGLPPLSLSDDDLLRLKHPSWNSPEERFPLSLRGRR